MNDRVSVNTSAPSPYIESVSLLHRLKRKLTYAFAFRLLNKFVDRRRELRILEIGTGSGFFLYFAKDYFPRGSFTGLEYDERLLSTTASRAPFATLVQGNAEDFDVGLGQYDVVVSFQVIEHLYEPTLMLNNVHAHLKPGGLFLVTTPNLTGLGAKSMGQNWHGYRDDHVSLKGMAEWESLIRFHGFDPLYSGSTFFSGIPLLNRFPIGVLNWMLLAGFGSLRWTAGESYVGLFRAVRAERR